MSTPLNMVTAAYNNASKLMQQSGKGIADAAPGGGQSPDFGKLLTDSMQGVMDVGKVSDKMSLDLVNGKANIVDVVTAISQTEIAMESMVTIRDKVISAYEEIMRMPI